VARRLALIVHAQGDRGRAQQIISELTNSGQILDPSLNALITDPPASETVKIGVILPLSGRGAEVGRHMLQGFRLANETVSSLPEVSLILRDDGGDPERAADAVDELVDEHEVAAILGPVGLRSTRAAAARASRHEVPLIVYHPNGTLGAEDADVFRYYVTPDSEARALVAHALTSNVRRVAILAPESGFGRAMTQAFSRAATAAGLEIAITLTYPNGTTAFGEIVEPLASVDWEALFVPDAWRALSFSIPTLAAAGIWSAAPGSSTVSDRRHYLLLAPGVAYSDELVERAGRYLTGASFSLAFQWTDPESAGHAFHTAYLDRYGMAPDSHAAYAHDTLTLLRTILVNHRGSAEAITDALANESRIPSPLTLGGGFNQEREAITPPSVSQLENGVLVRSSSNSSSTD